MKNVKKLFLVTALSFFAFRGYCQNLHLNFFGGIANYKGDLQYNPKGGKQISFKQPNFAAGIGLEYEISNKLYARLGIMLGKIGADDKKQPGQQQRNLNFSSPIFDVMLGAEYYILDPYTHMITPYIFAGAAYFHFNPYTFDAARQKVFLQPLSTEGEGFGAGRDPYNLSQFAIPFGGGIKLSLSDDVRVGIELSLRKTFTDYLDDVSTTYVDENILLAAKGQQSVDLAYRGDEVGAGPYPVTGTPRATLDGNDWYYFTGLTLSFRLGSGGGGGGGRGSGRKSKVGCPAMAR
ncbi:MAG: outer rane beta-barrel protein [Chitinophagaceae bacterium]|nr:outer rane beta-barrel protein [Chitinophagaceae bacterium]